MSVTEPVNRGRRAGRRRAEERSRPLTSLREDPGVRADQFAALWSVSPQSMTSLSDSYLRAQRVLPPIDRDYTHRVILEAVRAAGSSVPLTNGPDHANGRVAPPQLLKVGRTERSRNGRGGDDLLVSAPGGGLGPSEPATSRAAHPTSGTSSIADEVLGRAAATADAFVERRESTIARRTYAVGLLRWVLLTIVVLPVIYWVGLQVIDVVAERRRTSPSCTPCGTW